MLLIAQNLSKKYVTLQAVKDFSLTIKEGEVVGLLGPNGAGKSTIVGMLYGAVIPSNGTVKLGEYNLFSNQSRKAKSLIGVVTQDNNLDPDLTVLDNLLVFARYHGYRGKDALERAEQLLKLVNLTDKRKSQIDELSGGMKRRLILARALIGSPKVIFLDEPTTGLDPDARQDFWRLIVRLREEGVGILLTTHYMDEAERLSDRIILLQKGSIVDSGEPKELIEKTVGRSILEITGVNEEQVSELANKYNIWWRAFGEGFIIMNHESDDFYNDLNNLGASKITERNSNLEDVFLKLTGETL